MSRLTRVGDAGSYLVSYLDKDGRTAIMISTALAARRIWLGQPGVSQVELTGADALSIADDLKEAVLHLEDWRCANGG